MRAPASVAAPVPAEWDRQLGQWALACLQAGARDLHAEARDRFDQALLGAALQHTGGRRVEAAALLGNTPTQARTSYVDPRIVTHYERGRTVPREVVDRDLMRMFLQLWSEAVLDPRIAQLARGLHHHINAGAAQHFTVDQAQSIRFLSALE